MEILTGLMIIAVSLAAAVFVSPILIMAGVMGASDDSNAKLIYKILGYVVIVLAVLLPCFLFLLGVSVIL